MNIKGISRNYVICCICCFWVAGIHAQGFEWARQTEGAASAEGIAVATDPWDNVYVTGYFMGSTTFGGTTISGGPIFVAKYNPDGNLIWVSSADGTSNDRGYAITVDAQGNAYVTGTFSAFGNSTTFGDITLTGTDGENIFVAKIDSFGTWQWAVQAGSPTGGVQNVDFGNGIDVDAAGNTYICGLFKSTVDFGDTSLTSAGSSDIFLAKYNSSGQFQWARRAGGLAGDFASSITVDLSGNAYLTGGFFGTADFQDITFVSKGADDIFIAKYNTAGEQVWIHQVGGTTTDHGIGIVLDANNDAYICGALSSAFATFGDTTLNAAFKGSNIFLAKCHSEGDFAWARLAGDTFHGNIKGISTDLSGNFCITGYYQGLAIFAEDTLSVNTFADRNIFVINYNHAGEVQSAKNVLGIERTEGHGVGCDGSGNAYITGVFRDTVTFGNTTLATDNVPAMFITKFDLDMVGIQQGSIDAPSEFRLFQNYPNPFNPNTTIEFSLPQSGFVKLRVYDTLGKAVATLVSEQLTTGQYKYIWNANDLSSGLYVYRIEAANYSKSRKMLLIH